MKSRKVYLFKRAFLFKKKVQNLSEDSYFKENFNTLKEPFFFKQNSMFLFWMVISLKKKIFFSK